MVIVFVVVAVLVMAVIVTANWYVWRRLFRDTTRGPGLTRRVGAVLIAGGWILAITALVAERSGAPFWLQQVLAWPGFLWLALSIYLLLAVLAGEIVRPLLRRFLEHRARRTDQGAQPGPATSTASSPAGSAGRPTTAPDPAPASQPGGGGGAASTATAVPAAGTRAGGGGATASAAPDAASQRDGGADAPATAPAAPQANGSGTAPASEAGDAGGASASGIVAGSRAGGGATQASAPGQPTPGRPAPAAASQPGRGAAATVLPPPIGPGPDTSPEVSPEPAGTATPTGPSRRLFVSRVVAGAAAAAAVGTVGYGTYGVLRGPKVKRVTVPLAKLPRAAHGYRIAVVSDVHLGPVLGRGFAQKVVDTINSTQPDLIAVVGDLVDGSVKDLGPAAAPLAQLRARHGSYFVTGNHEYFSGAEQWVEEVRRLGIDPLENARREMPYFDLAGVNDVAGEEEGQGPDFAKALGDRDTARACVLLAHQPVQIHDAVEHGVDLQLSGHTHGGQLWPGNLIASGANPTLAGLDRYGDTQLYVSRGAGAWGPPTRVGAPSDITLIELASRRA
ncbi:metallophosphoesterase [Streptomyces collinus]|uniref:MPP superfamily phosphohydrolase n=1 Tax=Streptomyces collinus TaxID=42684 RepID=A0AA89QC65_STRCU|nr:metallophosphoesterase [Streptomyces collinus]MBB5813365.1 putative MPP superfamily phosphohydrolase [Streptomyces collinus]WMX66460.1 metallophosphoesterase [Streptomyces collinus]